MLDYVVLPGFHLPGSRASVSCSGSTKLSGSQRYVGLIFPGDAIRKIFLGTLVLGDENRAMQYRPGRAARRRRLCRADRRRTVGGW